MIITIASYAAKALSISKNHLIGDSQPDVKTKTTFTTMPFYQANSKLLPSGLLGPVQIEVQTK